MTAFHARLHLTQALARLLRGEAGRGRDELEAACRHGDGDDRAMAARLGAAAEAEPAVLVALAHDLGMDVDDFCRARVLAAYQDLDWRQIERWEAAVMASGKIPTIRWTAQVDFNAGRWERAAAKLRHLCCIDPEGGHDTMLGECLARLGRDQG